MNDITYAGKHLTTYSVTTHFHDTWELVYCTGGNGKFVFPDAEIDYRENDIVVIPPKIEHSNFSEKGFTNIHLNIEDATLSFRNAIILHDDSDHHILNAFSDAFYYYFSSIEKKQFLISSLGNLVISYIVALYDNVPSNSTVEAIKSNIVQNFQDPLYQLDAYLRSFPFSYDYLRKLFKNEVGMTPHAYLTDIRLSTAKNLLCSIDGSENNITKIANMCGYDEPLYFSRIFKKYYGCSPANFIKTNN